MVLRTRETSSVRRHRGYVLLLCTCLGVMVCLVLPSHLRALSTLGYLCLPLVLIRSLGMYIRERRWSVLRTRFYRLLAIITFSWSLVWYQASLVQSRVSTPLLLLWALLVGWSCERLIRNLSLERRINGEVLMGALAGYLLLGLTAGLLFSVLETVVPGSFAGAGVLQPPVLSIHGAPPEPSSPVWSIDFVQLNYFAFVTLTTTGYGDIHPATPQTQMLCSLVAISGTMYLALVMGLLISRYTVQDAAETAASDPDDDAAT